VITRILSHHASKSVKAFDLDLDKSVPQKKLWN